MQPLCLGTPLSELRDVADPRDVCIQEYELQEPLQVTTTECSASHSTSEECEVNLLLEEQTSFIDRKKSQIVPLCVSRQQRKLSKKRTFEGKFVSEDHNRSLLTKGIKGGSCWLELSSSCLEPIFAAKNKKLPSASLRYSKPSVTVPSRDSIENVSLENSINVWPKEPDWSDCSDDSSDSGDLLILSELISRTDEMLVDYKALGLSGSTTCISNRGNGPRKKTSRDKKRVGRSYNAEQKEAKIPSTISFIRFIS